MDNLDEYMERLERKEKIHMLQLPSFRVFKDQSALHQTRVVETLIDTDLKLKKIDDLSLNIIKYAISHRDKVKVSDDLLNKLYRKYIDYFNGRINN